MHIAEPSFKRWTNKDFNQLRFIGLAQIRAEVRQQRSCQPPRVERIHIYKRRPGKPIFMIGHKGMNRQSDLPQITLAISVVSGLTHPRGNRNKD